MYIPLQWDQAFTPSHQKKNKQKSTTAVLGDVLQQLCEVGAGVAAKGLWGS